MKEGANKCEGYIREERSEVYFLEKDFDGFYPEIRLYDFSFDEGDRIAIRDSYSAKYDLEGEMVKVLSVEAKSGLRCLNLFYDDIDGFYDTWMEGVGSLLYPLEPNNPMAVGATHKLLSCRIGDRILYHNDDNEEGSTASSEP